MLTDIRVLADHFLMALTDINTMPDLHHQHVEVEPEHRALFRTIAAILIQSIKCNLLHLPEIFQPLRGGIHNVVFIDMAD